MRRADGRRYLPGGIAEHIRSSCGHGQAQGLSLRWRSTPSVPSEAFSRIMGRDDVMKLTERQHQDAWIGKRMWKVVA